jgi:DNA repair photolyase
MPLNKSAGNMYPWVTHTWNTVKGECPHGCTYCYMHRWGKQKPVRFDEKELKTDLGSGNFIFVGSSCDMWADKIPWEWIERTLEYCEGKGNSYLFQSKNPKRFKMLPVDSVICTTIETNRWYPDVMKDSPHPKDRVSGFAWYDNLVKYITIEPVLDFDLDEMIELIKRCEPVQCNIGADSGNNHLPEPSKEKLLALIEELKKFTTIAKKTNLNRILNG